MKLGLITQIRDEIDIVETFTAHIASLFDKVYLIDHQSIDGSGDYLRQTANQIPGWKYFVLESKTKLQTAAINLLLPNIFDEGIDYLFLLDADEFIDISSRDSLEVLIQGKLENCGIGSLRWINCVSDSFSAQKFTPEKCLWIPPDKSRLEKVVLSRGFFEKYKSKFRVAAGNHCVAVADGYQLPEIAELGNLFHIPIRSKNQAVKKVLTTVISYRGYKKREPSNSYQYYDMLRKIANGEISNSDISGYTLGYESSEFPSQRISKTDLRNQGYKKTTLDALNVSFSREINFGVLRNYFPVERMVANALMDLEEELTEDAQLKLEGNELRVVGSDPGIGFQHRISWATKRELELINDVKALEIENDSLRQEIYFYESSNSWKITKPLRIAGKIIRHIL